MNYFNGTIEKIISRKGDWACISFLDQKTKQRETAKGIICGEIYEGIEIELEGTYINHPTYGRQIDITSVAIKESATITFLYKCIKGIGHSQAVEIVEKFGENCIDEIILNPEILCDVKGIKSKRLKMIADSLDENKNIQKFIDVFRFFNNDITYLQAERIVEVCLKEKRGIENIKQNPYWLIAHVDGFGFKRVDKLAMASGIGEFSLERISAAIVYVLRDVSKVKGHCFLHLNELTREVVNLLLEMPEGITKKEFVSIQEQLISGNCIIDDDLESVAYPVQMADYVEKFDLILDKMSDALIIDMDDNMVVIEDEKIYIKILYDIEKQLAESIYQMSLKDPVKRVREEDIDDVIANMEMDENMEYAPEQVQAVKDSLKHRLSVISGGPGRGKTTILKLILECWNDDSSVVLLAPTGKAAKKMSEATGRKAKTIHSYRLEVGAFGTTGSELRSKAERPKGNLIVLDESSMVGIEMANLLLWIAEDCNLTLVGDVEQLESIEPGMFLSDIIQSGHVNTTFLVQGYRSDGSIAKNAQMISNGKGPSSYQYDGNFAFIEAEKEEIPVQVKLVYRELLKKYVPSDIGIISPIKKRGYGCVENLNEVIRNEFNPETARNGNNLSGFRIYDRVMNIVNNYNRKTTDSDGVESKGVFNGDSGVVVDIDNYNETLDVEFDDGKSTTYKFSELSNVLIPAYAITTHKSQGSEYKALIVIVSSEHTFFMKRKLFYTAVTRARDEEYLIGSKKTAALAAKSESTETRNSDLKRRIQSLFEKDS